MLRRGFGLRRCPLLARPACLACCRATVLGFEHEHRQSRPTSVDRTSENLFRDCRFLRRPQRFVLSYRLSANHWDEGRDDSFAHKQENVVDMDTGSITTATLSGGTAGDTKAIENSLEMAENNLADARQQTDEKTRGNMAERITEAVTDKGYHPNDVLSQLTEASARTMARI